MNIFSRRFPTVVGDGVGTCTFIEGNWVGDELGCPKDGEEDGSIIVGVSDVEIDGKEECMVDGDSENDNDGYVVGSDDDKEEGDIEDSIVGRDDGKNDGDDDGPSEGLDDGIAQKDVDSDSPKLPPSFCTSSSTTSL